MPVCPIRRLLRRLGPRRRLTTSWYPPSLAAGVSPATSITSGGGVPPAPTVALTAFPTATYPSGRGGGVTAGGLRIGTGKTSKTRP